MLLQAAGVLRPEGEPTEALMERLVSEATRMLRARVVLSPADWLLLSAEERDAFAAAGEGLAVVDAIRLGTASQGPRAAAEVASSVDGGLSRERVALSEALNDVVARAQRKDGAIPAPTS